MFLDKLSTCCLKEFCSAMEASFSCVSLSNISCARYNTWSNSCFCVCSFVWYWLIASCSCRFSCCSLFIWARRAFSSLLWLSCNSLKLFSNWGKIVERFEIEFRKRLSDCDEITGHFFQGPLFQQMRNNHTQSPLPHTYTFPKLWG